MTVEVRCSVRGLRHRTINVIALDAATLKILSTLSILAPLAWNGIQLKRSGLFGRIFFSYLLLGFLTDASFWYIHANQADVEPMHIFNAYSLAEALFFFWLIWSLAPNSSIKKVSALFLGCTPVLWGFILGMPLVEGKSAQSAPFVVSYEIAVSFLAGFALLALAEKHSQLWHSWEFWFLLGIFFYCFCTFFVMTFLGKALAASLWPLNNIINMFTYLAYCLGWWTYRPSTPKPIA